MKNLFLILVTLGLGSVSAQTTQDFEPGFSTGTSKFITGAKAKRYFDRLSETVAAKDSQKCSGVQYASGYTMPIGLKDKMAYALHVRYFGGRCVDCHCHDFGDPVPVSCIKFNRNDGTEDYQCVMELEARGRIDHRFREQPAVQKIMTCTDRS